MRRILLALALLAVLAPALPGQAAEEPDAPPRVSDIKSVLRPPFNYYSVETYDSEGAALEFAWSLQGAGACTDFRWAPGSPNATWRHDDPERCPHDAGDHPGVITVTVSDGASRVTRTYEGGSAPFNPTGEWNVTAAPPPAPPPQGDPRDEPVPAIYGEELDCLAFEPRGAFEPVQAVFQDEDPEKFNEEEGRRLVQVSPRRLRAELDMVVEKPSLLFGIRGDRQHITYQVELTGSTLAPAEVRWILTEPDGARHVIGRKDVGPQLIAGTCGGGWSETMVIDTAEGLDSPHFFFRQAGAYTITMELAARRAEHVPGSRIELRGEARAMPPLHLGFEAITFQEDPAAAGFSLLEAANLLAFTSQRLLPDYFPLPPGGVTTEVRPAVRDARGFAAAAGIACGHAPGEVRYSPCFVNTIMALATSALHMGAWQSAATGGTAPDRIVAVMSRPDMGWVYMIPGVEGGIDTVPLGLTQGGFDKPLFVRADGDHWTVAHELTHTVPNSPWLSDGEVQCGRAYHNAGGRLANGFQTSYAGSRVREAQFDRGGYMSNATHDTWIEQCTYAHLLDGLQQLADPAVLGVRGWLARVNGTERATLQPGLSFEGRPDRTPGGAGSHAVVLRDAAGAALATYRFNPAYDDGHGRLREVASFGMLVERPAGLARVELARGPQVLAAMAVTAAAPTVRITAPAPGTPVPAGPLSVAWDAADPDGGNLSYAVLVTTNGTTWFDVAVDLAATSLVLDPVWFRNATAPQVMVVATDGVNSANATLALRGGASPPASPAPPGSAAPPPAAPPPAGSAPAPEVGPVAVLAALVVMAALARRERR